MTKYVQNRALSAACSVPQINVASLGSPEEPFQMEKGSFKGAVLHLLHVSPPRFSNSIIYNASGIKRLDPARASFQAVRVTFRTRR